MNPILISLIIPVYNVGDYIEECLISVLEQDSGLLEVIIIDDCSKDGSLRIVNLYQDRFINLTVIKNEVNIGLGNTRNKGIEVASGRYLVFLDSDDWLNSNAIEKIISHTQTSPDVIQYGCNKIYDTGKIDSSLYCVDYKGRSLLETQLGLLTLPNYVWLKAVSREFVSKHGLCFLDILYEDIPWNIGVLTLADSITTVPEALYNYRQRKGSILQTKSQYHLDLLDAYSIAFSNIRDYSTLKYRLAINNSFITASYYLYRERNVRLTKNSEREFSTRYLHIITEDKVFPSSPKAAAMFLILGFQTVSNLLLKVISFRK